MSSEVEPGLSGSVGSGPSGRNGDEDSGERVSGPDQISNDDLFEVLSNRRRRYTLHYLKQHADEAVEMGDLSTQIAAWETGSPPEELAYDERKRVHTSLYQYHAPKLDDAGIVDYDSDRKTIILRKSARQVDLYMEVVTKYGVTWATYYRAIGTISLLSIVLASTDTPLVSAIDPLLWASLFLMLIAVSTLYQFWSRRWLYLQQLL